VDREHRLDIARNHTATHLLQYALRKVLGTHVQQRGSLVHADRLRFDFSHLEPLNREEIVRTELLINEAIRDGLPVFTEEAPYQKALDAGALAFFGDKYDDIVRIVRIGEPPVSTELCGGTHVSSSSEIGFCHIVSEWGIGAGIRRIEAVTGRGAEAYTRRLAINLEEAAALLKVAPEGAGDKIQSLLTDLETTRRRLTKLERQLSSGRVDSLLGQTVTVNGIALLAARLPEASSDMLRETYDVIRERLPSAVVVLGSVFQKKPVFLAAVSDDLVERNYDAGKIVKAVAQIAGGSGGGKPRLAQAGGRDASRVDAALAAVPDIITGGN
jgi:alanyl-tRNA synthetase